jgi:hypothetical protein
MCHHEDKYAGYQCGTCAHERLNLPVLERRLTAPGVTPVGEGWTCIHSSASPDGTQWWLWQRFAQHSAFCGQDGEGSCTCGGTMPV